MISVAKLPITSTGWASLNAPRLTVSISFLWPSKTVISFTFAAEKTLVLPSRITYTLLPSLLSVMLVVWVLVGSAAMVSRPSFSRTPLGGVGGGGAGGVSSVEVLGGALGARPAKSTVILSVLSV